MVQLAFVMRILSVLCKCVKANSPPEEGDEKDESRQNNTQDNVDGTEVIVTNATVNNVTCCGARATNQNQDEVYSKTPVTDTSNIDEEQTRSDDVKSSSETIPSAEEYSRKRGSRIILEIRSYECPE